MAEAAEEEVSLRFHVTLNVISSSKQQLHFNFNNLIFTVNNKMPKKNWMRVLELEEGKNADNS